MPDGTAPGEGFDGNDINTWKISNGGDLIIEHIARGEVAPTRLTRYIPIKFIGEQLWFLSYDIDPSGSKTVIGWVQQQRF